MGNQNLLPSHSKLLPASVVADLNKKNTSNIVGSKKMGKTPTISNKN